MHAGRRWVPGHGQLYGFRHHRIGAASLNQARGQVLRPANIEARDRGGGASTIPLASRATGSTTIMSGITMFSPGAATPRHFHNCEECVQVLEGKATAEIDGVEHSLEPGDVSFIPAGIPHCFRNASNIERMRIYWTYASIDATRTIIETGKTTWIEWELGLVE